MGAIVCKLDKHRGAVQRGYIAMLAVDKDFRKKKIGALTMQELLVGLCTVKTAGGRKGMNELLYAHVQAPI